MKGNGISVQIQVLGVNIYSAQLEQNEEDPNTNVQVKAKTKWTYITVPISTKVSDPAFNLPTYFTSSDSEKLFLFIEAWKDGVFQGLTELNLRDINKKGMDFMKWLQLRCPIKNKATGNLLLRLEVTEQELLKQSNEPISSENPSSEFTVQQHPSSLASPQSHLFMNINSRGSSTISGTTSSSSAVSGVVSTNNSSPVYLNSVPHITNAKYKQNLDSEDIDVASILNQKLEILTASLEKCRSFKSSKENSPQTSYVSSQNKTKQEKNSVPPSLPGLKKKSNHLPARSVVKKQDTGLNKKQDSHTTVVIKSKDDRFQLPRKRTIGANFNRNLQPPHPH